MMASGAACRAASHRNSSALRRRAVRESGRGGPTDRPSPGPAQDASSLGRSHPPSMRRLRVVRVAEVSILVAQRPGCRTIHLAVCRFPGDLGGTRDSGVLDSPPLQVGSSRIRGHRQGSRVITGRVRLSPESEKEEGGRGPVLPSDGTLCPEERTRGMKVPPWPLSPESQARRLRDRRITSVLILAEVAPSAIRRPISAAESSTDTRITARTAATTTRRAIAATEKSACLSHERGAQDILRTAATVLDGPEATPSGIRAARRSTSAGEEELGRTSNVARAGGTWSAER